MHRQGLEFFSQIPENLFSVFSGSLREIYIDLLFLVYGEYQRRVYTLSREDIVEIFTQYLESLDERDWQVEEEHLLEEVAKNARERAFQLLRRLVDTGWFNLEPEPDYTFRISVPDYAVILLDAMDKIRTGYRVEFRGRVLSIYQNLTGQEGFSYVALQQAYESAVDLINGLKSLNHSIKNYTEKLLETDDVRSILNQIFDEYQANVLGDQYHRLKTSEHISKYRIGILKRIREWQSNRPEIYNQSEMMVKEKQAADRGAAENILYEWLEYLENCFGEEMDKLLREIDHRNARYARSAAERLRLKLHGEKGKGQDIFTVLYYLGELAREQGEKTLTPDKISTALALSPQAFVDSQSPRKPPVRRQPHKPQPLPATPISAEVRKQKLARFGARIAQEITVEQVNNYVLEMLAGRDECPLEQLPLETSDHWVKLIYIILYSRSKKARYHLEGQRGETISVKGGTAEIPNLVIKREEKQM